MIDSAHLIQTAWHSLPSLHRKRRHSQQQRVRPHPGWAGNGMQNGRQNISEIRRCILPPVRSRLAEAPIRLLASSKIESDWRISGMHLEDRRHSKHTQDEIEAPRRRAAAAILARGVGILRISRKGGQTQSMADEREEECGYTVSLGDEQRRHSSLRRLSPVLRKRGASHRSGCARKRTAAPRARK